MMSPRVLFYGVRTDAGAGHYLCEPSGHASGRQLASAFPTALRHLDAVWCWPTPQTAEQVKGNYGCDQPQGRGYIHHVDGSTDLRPQGRGVSK